MQNNGIDDIKLPQFLSLMKVFCYETDNEEKKVFMFRIYDKKNKGSVPILDLRNILTNELFTRSHYDDVSNAAENPSQQANIKSSYSDRVMKDVMVEIMDEYDTDKNKAVDPDEFKAIVSDSDVDMLLSIYWKYEFKT